MSKFIPFIKRIVYALLVIFASLFTMSFWPVMLIAVGWGAELDILGILIFIGLIVFVWVIVFFLRKKLFVEMKIGLLILVIVLSVISFPLFPNLLILLFPFTDSFISFY